MPFDFEQVLRYYTRKDVQREMLALARDREIGVNYGNRGYGKRPDVLQYPSDILELVKKGATSFHLSEERWSNPLDIKTGMTRKELDQLRAGWDCVLDIDSQYIEYSQITAHLIMEALKFNDIKSASVKFSGNKGFHILIPFEAMPTMIGNTPIQLLFPEGPRMIATYIKNMIAKHLTEKILEKSSLQEIAKAVKKPIEELTKGKDFDPFVLVDIDTILISSRHLFRSAYALNEKSGLVSIPLEAADVMKFKLQQAKIENVKTDVSFLKQATPGEGSRLVLQAFDQVTTKEIMQPKTTVSFLGTEYFPQEKQKRPPQKLEFSRTNVKEEYFPQCVQKILQGMKSDGRKRALFVLINFFKSLKLSSEEIQERLKEWNKKNYEPLREGYVVSQAKWHDRKKDSFLPPNCNNEGYYKDMGVKCSDTICLSCKNPINYTLRKIKDEQQKKKTKKRIKRPRKTVKFPKNKEKNS